MIERIGIPLVLVCLLTFALVETNIMTTGLFISVGLNIALLLVVVQVMAMLYGITRSLVIFHKMEQSPLYSPKRASLIQSQKKEGAKN